MLNRPPAGGNTNCTPTTLAAGAAHSTLTPSSPPSSPVRSSRQQLPQRQHHHQLTSSLTGNNSSSNKIVCTTKKRQWTQTVVGIALGCVVVANYWYASIHRTSSRIHNSNNTILRHVLESYRSYSSSSSSNNHENQQQHHQQELDDQIHHITSRSYDVCIVGAGWTGSVLAERYATIMHQSVLLIDRKSHIGGHAYDEKVEHSIRLSTNTTTKRKRTATSSSPSSSSSSPASTVFSSMTTTSIPFIQYIPKYGPHVFHTKSKLVQQYVSQFSSWIPYRHQIRAAVTIPIPSNATLPPNNNIHSNQKKEKKNSLLVHQYHLNTYSNTFNTTVPLPINMETVNTLYHLQLQNLPQYIQWLQQQIQQSTENHIGEMMIQSIQQQIRMKFGSSLYHSIIHPLWKKLWGIHYEDSLLMESLLIRSTNQIYPNQHNDQIAYRYDGSDHFQGIPSTGYTSLFERMLSSPLITIQLNIDYFQIEDQLSCHKTYYTGSLDEYFVQRKQQQEEEDNEDHDDEEGEGNDNSTNQQEQEQVQENKMNNHKMKTKKNVTTSLFTCRWVQWEQRYGTLTNESIYNTDSKTPINNVNARNNNNIQMHQTFNKLNGTWVMYYPNPYLDYTACIDYRYMPGQSIVPISKVLDDQQQANEKKIDLDIKLYDTNSSSNTVQSITSTSSTTSTITTTMKTRYLYVLERYHDMELISSSPLHSANSNNSNHSGQSVDSSSSSSFYDDEGDNDDEDHVCMVMPTQTNLALYAQYFSWALEMNQRQNDEQQQLQHQSMMVRYQQQRQLQQQQHHPMLMNRNESDKSTNSTLGSSKIINIKNKKKQTKWIKLVGFLKSDTLEYLEMDEAIMGALQIFQEDTGVSFQPENIHESHTIISHRHASDKGLLSYADMMSSYANIPPTPMTAALLQQIEQAMKLPLPQEPTGLKNVGHPPGHDAVIALALYPQYIHRFRIFVGSLRQSGYDGHIILGVHPAISNEEELFLQKMEVTYYVVNATTNCDPKIVIKDVVDAVHLRNVCPVGLEQLKLEWAKYELARQWLVECRECTGWTLLCDTFDVVFQVNPFRTLPNPNNTEHNLLFVEDIAPHSNPTPEAKHRADVIGESRYLWKTEACYGKEHYRPYYSRPVLNCGTVFGTRSGMQRFLSVMVYEFYVNNQRTNEKCKSPFTTDQWTMNYLYYQGRFGEYNRTRTIPYGTGPVQTLGSVCVNRKASGSVKYSQDDLILFNRQDHILNVHEAENSTARVAAVLHQYDRCQGWFSKWLNRHPELTLSIAGRLTPLEQLNVPWLADTAPKGEGGTPVVGHPGLYSFTERLRKYTNRPVVEMTAELSDQVQEALLLPVSKPLALVHKSTPPGNDTVVGLAMYPGNMRSYRLFVGSLRNTGFDGHIILGVDDNITRTEEAFLRMMDVTYYKVKAVDCHPSIVETASTGFFFRHKCAEGLERLKLEWARYELFRQWLTDCDQCTGWSLIADTKDVFFQANPFGSLRKPHEAISDLLLFEDLSPQSNPMADHPYRAEVIGESRYLWRTTECYGNDHYQNYTNRPVLNSGTVIGSRSGLLRFLSVLVDEFHHNNAKNNTKCHSPFTTDQWTMNYLYYHGRFGHYDSTLSVPFGTGPVANIGPACLNRRRDEKDRNGQIDMITFDSGRIVQIHEPVNSKARIAAVVHDGADLCASWLYKWIGSHVSTGDMVLPWKKSN